MMASRYAAERREPTLNDGIEYQRVGQHTWLFSIVRARLD